MKDITVRVVMKNTGGLLENLITGVEEFRTKDDGLLVFRAICENCMREGLYLPYSVHVHRSIIHGQRDQEIYDSIAVLSFVLGFRGFTGGFLGRLSSLCPMLSFIVVLGFIAILGFVIVRGSVVAYKFTTVFKFGFCVVLGLVGSSRRSCQCFWKV